MSISTDQTISDKIIDLINSTVLAIGAMMCFVTTFSISYSLGEFYKGGIIGGFIKTYNDMATALGNSDFLIIAKHSGAAEHSELFITLMTIVIMIIVILIMKGQRLWLLGMFYILPIGASLLLHVSPGALGILLLMSGTIYMAIGKHSENRIAAVTFLVIAVSLTVAISGTSLYHSLSGSKLEKTTASYVGDKMEQLRYGDGTLGDGDLTLTKRPESTETAFTVTMENPQSMYLRGFIGEKLNGYQWESLSAKEHYSSVPLTNTLKANDFNGLGQLSQAAALSGMTLVESKISINVKNASTKYAYIPYEITDINKDNMKNWSNSFLTGTGLTGISGYEYTATSNLTGQWTDVAGKLFQENYVSQLEKYNLLESYYNEDVYRKYTYLDDDTISALTSEIGSRGNQEKGHVDYKVAIKLVKEYFDEKITYSKYSAGEASDAFLQSFFSSKKGFDVDYATAATLMFRYYGIPARYVEGYLITKADASEMQAHQPYGISESNAHGWTEIYVDTVGWVPIEICSEYYGVMDEADLTKGLDSESNTNPFNLDESQGKQSISVNDDGTDVRNVKWSLILLWLGFALGLVLVIAAGVLTYRRLARSLKYRRAFRDKDIKKAVAAMYAYGMKRDILFDSCSRDLGREAMYSNHEFKDEKARVILAKSIKEGRRKKGRNEQRKKKNIIFNKFSNFSLSVSRLWNRRRRKEG